MTTITKTTIYARIIQSCTNTASATTFHLKKCARIVYQANVQVILPL